MPCILARAFVANGRLNTLASSDPESTSAWLTPTVAISGSVNTLLETVSSNVFTDPEIATVGVSQADVDSGAELANVFNLPLATNARAKMQGISEGFVKIFCRPDTGVIVGGVVVAPKASELIFSIALAVEHRLTVDQMSQTITVYPSLSGSIAEAARQLHQTQNLN